MNYFHIVFITLIVSLSAGIADAKNCKKGKPCGNTCIANDKACHRDIEPLPSLSSKNDENLLINSSPSLPPENLSFNTNPSDNHKIVVIDSQPDGGSLLTMQARNRPLREILQEIAAQAKVEITVRGAVEQPVFADLRRIPLEEGLRRITQNFNSLFVYTAQRGSGSPLLNKVLLYAKEGEGGRNGAASPSAVFRPGVESAPPLQPEPALPDAEEKSVRRPAMR